MGGKSKRLRTTDLCYRNTLNTMDTFSDTFLHPVLYMYTKEREHTSGVMVKVSSSLVSSPGGTSWQPCQTDALNSHKRHRRVSLTEYCSTGKTSLSSVMQGYQIPGTLIILNYNLKGI